LIGLPTIFSGASTDATIAEPPCQVPQVWELACAGGSTQRLGRSLWS
jgi:hypothetical protein